MKKENIVYVKKTLEVEKELYHKIKVKVARDGETFKTLVNRLFRDYIKSVEK